MRANLATLNQRLERTEPPSVVPPRRGRGLQPDERPEWSCGAARKGTAPDARPPWGASRQFSNANTISGSSLVTPDGLVYVSTVESV
jgi:hypothetical protein